MATPFDNLLDDYHRGLLLESDPDHEVLRLIAELVEKPAIMFSVNDLAYLLGGMASDKEADKLERLRQMKVRVTPVTLKPNPFYMKQPPGTGKGV